MRRFACFIVSVLTILVILPVNAHEFWMIAAPFSAAGAKNTQVNLYVGQFFEGELVPLSAQYVAQFQRFTMAGIQNLMPFVPRSSATGISLQQTGAGSQVLSINTHPNFVQLSKDQFTYYLADEGLTNIQSLLKNGVAPKVANRERYQRHIKALVLVDGDLDDTLLHKTGQRLEILPLADPRLMGRALQPSFQVLFEGKPLAGVLLKAWSKIAGQTLLIRSVADENGMVRLTLPFNGIWMLSAVHMLPIQNDLALDWESFWANLTFEIP